MHQETFIIGEKEYTCIRMNPFEANRILLRLQKVVLPVVGQMSGGSNLLDMDLKEAAVVLAQHLDESLMDTIVLPMLSESKVYSTSDKKFVRDAISINQVFTTESLMDLYELIWFVGRFQFAPFFASVMQRFGAVLAVESTAPSQASLTKQ